MLLGGPGGIRLKPNCAVCVCGADNPLLSMNFDRYKGNKRRRNRGRKKREGAILYLRRALLLWAARQQNLKCSYLEEGSKTEL